MLGQAIRVNAGALLTRSMSDELVRELGKACPAVTKATGELGLDAELPAVLAALLRDGVPVRNMLRILQLLLRYRTAPEESAGVDRITAVRAGLADHIAASADGSGVVSVLLLDPKVEEALAGNLHGEAAGRPDEKLTDEMCLLLYERQRYLYPRANRPVVLTRDDLRANLQDRIRHEFPEYLVLGYGDLPPDCTVTPVERLSWR